MTTAAQPIELWYLKVMLSPSHKYTTPGYTSRTYPCCPNCNTNTPSPTLCTFHPPPRLTLPGCHNDWLSTLQPEGMMSSHHCLSLCPSRSLTYCFSSVCLKPVSWNVFSISLLFCLSGWLRAWLSVWLTSSSFVRIKSLSHLPPVFYQPSSSSHNFFFLVCSFGFTCPGALESWMAWWFSVTVFFLSFMYKKKNKMFLCMLSLHYAPKVILFYSSLCSVDVLRLLSSGEGGPGEWPNLWPQPVSGLPVWPGVPSLLHGCSPRQPDHTHDNNWMWVKKTSMK